MFYSKTARCSRWTERLCVAASLLLIWIVDTTDAFAANVDKVGRKKAHYTRSPPTNFEGNSASEILVPGDTFRDTRPGEISVTSCNVLAPFYHSLALEEEEFRESYADADREDRFPLAIELAKQSNADILILQEVEGGEKYEPRLKELLAISSFTRTHIARGYDSYLWSPLHPERDIDCVGLCVAWRSDRHRLVKSSSYHRGMVCQFTEVVDDESSVAAGTFAIANIHLPARPDNIMGRLFAMSRTIQKLGAYDVRRRLSPLDGLLMVAGDWNCDQTSMPANLLRDGRTKFGNIREGEHEAIIYKSVANRMKHGYRFQDVYRSIRDDYAPVTVSLHGREPACMDHLFCAQRDEPPRRRPPSQSSTENSETSIPSEPINGSHDPSNPKVALVNGATVGSSHAPANGATATDENSTTEKVNPTTTPVKSSVENRERMSSTRPSRRNNTRIRRSHMQVEAVMATIAGPDDTERLDKIYKGLPNVEAGFPSDHIPIGALFVPHPEFRPSNVTSGSHEEDDDDDDDRENDDTTDDTDHRASLD